MAQASSKIVAIIDPGLMAAGGHHAGLAAMAANSVSRQPGVQVKFICHKNIDKDISTPLEQAGCEMRAELTTNFYEYFKQAVSLPDIQPYILQLSKEYISSIQDISRQHKNDEIIFFYPSLGWQHAYCLSLALAYLPHTDSAKHIACAMFNPSIGYRGKIKPTKEQLNHALGFGTLDKHKSLSLYASDKELAVIYADLLDRVQPLPVHPCYLADWPRVNKGKQASNAALNVILYMGDAKENKGFCVLPGIAREILADKTLDIELTIQYTLSWADEVITNTTEELAAIAKDDKRLMLYDGFLSDNDLHSYLRRADLFVFTYEADAYRDKNSGLLWLIGWLQTPVSFLHSSWLHREALRIELPILEINNGWTNLKQRINDTKAKQEEKNVDINQYRAVLYRSFWDWIASF